MDNTIDIQINSRIERKDRFAIYHLPGDSKCTLIDLETPKPFSYIYLNTNSEYEGFAVVPFDETESAGWWFTSSDEWQIPFTPGSEKTSDRTDIICDINNDGFDIYASQFSLMMESLKRDELKKVVLSRVIKNNISIQKNISRLFQLLCREYPGAFVYLLSTPETGVWTGASPELLLKKQDKDYTTVALAGTHKINDMDPDQWKFKEMEEQNFVSTYIDRLLEKHGINNYKKTGPAITKAGSVTHLKTTYQFSEDPAKWDLGNFIHDMHPTPALGGEPKEPALDLIRKVEKHKRSLYGGFLGPVSKQKTDLFVNIRCMKIENDNMQIYAGGGLTTGSELLQEWNETILKSQTLLSVINMLKK